MFVFLIETKVRRKQVELIRTQLGFEGLFCVENSGLGGGLALFWRDKDVATLLGYSQNYIDVVVSLPGKAQYRLTCFYGYPERARRQQSWELLRYLKE